MPLKYLICAALLVALARPADADLLRARRASVMCASSAALAQLALPEGGSRDVGDHVPPAIDKIAHDGNCNDFPEGHVVILERARRHTSIVRSDSLTGDGVMIEVLVANIDYGPYTPPHDDFYDTIRAQCPTLLEGIAAEDPPRNDFIKSLPPPLRASIDKAVDNNCGDQLNCMIRTQADEIEQRHLQGRWAGFLCAHPSIALEPSERSPAPLRE